MKNVAEHRGVFYVTKDDILTLCGLISYPTGIFCPVPYT
jgi:hypothetical protein